MTPPGTFDRVYVAIKQRLRGGAFRPGQKLEPAGLSDELNASVTPVRDALHRLTGERLVEAPRHEGFRAPLLTESMLRQLYAWHRDLLLLATGRRWAERERSPVETPPGASHLQLLDAEFAGLAADSGNSELAIALRNLSERLEPYRRFEHEFLGALDAETGQIVCAIRAQDLRSLRRALDHYHRRREQIVPQLLARLHDHG